MSGERNNMGIEIERKFTVKKLPENLENYPFHEIEQAYLNVHPAIRVRRQDDIYYMTYKGTPGDMPSQKQRGDISQVEYNMPLDKESYEHMSSKADGNVIRKTRYLIPINDDAFDEDYVKACTEVKSLTIELDVFKAPFDGTIIAEVEFPDEDAARNYHPASWFDEDVTGDPRYHNSVMSRQTFN